jgi:hypothetical protein
MCFSDIKFKKRETDRCEIDFNELSQSILFWLPGYVIPYIKERMRWEEGPLNPIEKQMDLTSNDLPARVCDSIKLQSLFQKI